MLFPDNIDKIYNKFHAHDIITCFFPLNGSELISTKDVPCAIDHFCIT